MPLNLPPMKSLPTKKKATPPVVPYQVPPPRLRKPVKPGPIAGGLTPPPSPIGSPTEAKKRGQKKALGIGG